MSDSKTLNLPAAARRFGVSVRTLRQAIRLGNIPAPANLNATTSLSSEWLASAKSAVGASPKALNVTPQKVPAFARYEGTSAFRKYPNRVREYNDHKNKTRPPTDAPEGREGGSSIRPTTRRTSCIPGSPNTRPCPRGGRSPRSPRCSSRS